jgi:hypothetical protein
VSGAFLCESRLGKIKQPGEEEAEQEGQPYEAAELEPIE